MLIGYALALVLFGPATLSFGRLFEEPLPLWTYFLYLQNFAMVMASSYGAVWMAGSWSLAFEEQFYLTLPAAVRRVSDRTLGWFALAGLLSPLVLRAVVQTIQDLSADWKQGAFADSCRCTLGWHSRHAPLAAST